MSTKPHDTSDPVKKSKPSSEIGDGLLLDGPKIVTLTKLPGVPWKMSVEGAVRQLDINHLRRLLIVEYRRMKRRERLEHARSLRNKPVAHKESVDAAS